MKKFYLLPNRCKPFGWVLLIVSVLFGAITLIDYKFELSTYYGIIEITNTVAVAGIWLGVILVCCSREKIEDEMIVGLRLNALLLAFYLQAVILVLATLLVYGFAYLDVMMYNLVMFPVFFFIAYRVMLFKFNRLLNDE